MAAWPHLGPEERHALLLSTFAGLSTSIGAVIAIARRPDDATLAFLLGVAFGVMLLLSVAELWVRASLEHGWPPVTGAVVAGAALYAGLSPLLPTFESVGGTMDAAKDTMKPKLSQSQDCRSNGQSSLVKRAASGGTQPAGGSESDEPQQPGTTQAHKGALATAADTRVSLRPAELLRLSFLMALTMTLHNLPEGFAVAFSSYTDFGPIMAVAIAVHNVPEGIIVAAPVYAATGSRWRALLLATASGLSEPLGALLALLVVKPLVDVRDLHLLLAFVGGIMGAVCVLELLPEGRKCKHDVRLAAGAAMGAAIMGWTLWVGV